MYQELVIRENLVTKFGVIQTMHLKFGIIQKIIFVLILFLLLNEPAKLDAIKAPNIIPILDIEVWSAKILFLNAAFGY